MKKNHLSIKHNEQGIVSIFVTIIIILLMSLIILAMVRNATREGRQSLDRQLSDQAFYNAESGINDWTKFINKNKNNPALPIEKKECDPNQFSGSFPGADYPKNFLDIDGTNRYTCVKYNRQPSYLVSENSSDNSDLFLIKPASLVNTLKVSWKVSPANLASCNFGGNTLPTSAAATNCRIGGLRLELFKRGLNSKDAYISDSMVAYAFPKNSSGGGIINYNSSRGDQKGVKILADCNGNECSVIIGSGLNINPALNDQYYLIVKRIYLTADTSTVTVSGYAGGSPNAVAMIDSQIELDVTGRANDVLRRIKVHKPLENQYNQTGTGVDGLSSAQSICKQIKVQIGTDPNTATSVLDSCTP